MHTSQEWNLTAQTLEDIAELAQNDEPLNPNYTNEKLHALYSLAYHLYQSGDYSQAKKIFHQLVLLKPYKTEYWFSLASSLQKEKKYEEALKTWSMTVLLDFEDPIPHFHAAECYFSLEDPCEGYKALQAATDSIKGNNPILVDRIKALKTRWKEKEGQ